jgi:GR25 family glycosyltransferase involved in LPS biosynthesis
MRIFVVNAYPERRSKYDDRYEIYDAVWWEDLTDEDIKDYYLRYNAKTDLRKKVVACSKSHKNLLMKIIKEDLKNVVIIEDDAIIEDFERLKELEEVNEFCYIGGDITSPLLKNMKDFKSNGEKDNLRFEFIKGINQINPKEFKIGQTCGYYIPNSKVAQHILSNIPVNDKERAIDNEYMYLQKRGVINYFIYPALSVLNVEEARKGFTYSNHKLYDNQSEY